MFPQQVVYHLGDVSPVLGPFVLIIFVLAKLVEYESILNVGTEGM